MMSGTTNQGRVSHSEAKVEIPTPRLPNLQGLGTKLLASFVLVAVVAVGIVAVLANRTTTRQFQLYVSQGRQRRAEQLVPEFAAYYARASTWAGVGEWMIDLIESQAAGPGQGRGPGLRAGASLDRILLADAAGRVLADSQGDLAGEQLSGAELAFGAPIEVDGQLVGTLLAPAAEGIHESLEADFLGQVNRALLWAGLAAGGVALLLGLLLTRQLTSPLRKLTQAAHRLAQGDVPQVEVRGRDEVGELSQAFNQMAQSLAQQETLRRNLMAEIAHELRTPLSVIRGDLEALLDGVYQPTPEALASLQEETLLLTRLVEDLRDLAQAGAGQLRLARQSTDLTDLLRGVILSFQPLAESQGQTLTMDLPPDLPPVVADPQRLRQVVANLLSNALRHAATEGGQVRVSAVQQTDQVQVSVTDNGPGIAPQDLPHVFDRFWQGGAGRGEGSGLGLTIARELVRAQGGRIWVDSEPGAGSAFHFTLPLDR
jgi:two-component system OmpR family sensor kinase/two-component system sensor histidine kinase BaeS